MKGRMPSSLAKASKAVTLLVVSHCGATQSSYDANLTGQVCLSLRLAVAREDQFRCLRSTLVIAGGHPACVPFHLLRISDVMDALALASCKVAELCATPLPAGAYTVTVSLTTRCMR